MIWGDYGKLDRKVFMGVCQIFLDDLDLSQLVIGWYKLFTTASLCDPPSSDTIAKKAIEREEQF